MSKLSRGPIPLGVKCCPGSSLAGPRPRPPRFTPPSPPPPLLLLSAGPLLLAAGRGDEDGDEGDGSGDSLFPPLPPPPPPAPLPGARLNEKDDPRTSRLSRLLPPPPPLPPLLPPSLLPPLGEEEEEEAAAAARGACACGRRVAPMAVPRLWGLRTKARPCRQADAACVDGVWIGLRVRWGWLYPRRAPHETQRDAPAPRRAPP